ncbi:MAG: hypothetical protein C4293_17650 [Nitrospiraceae bacterium]
MISIIHDLDLVIARLSLHQEKTFSTEWVQRMFLSSFLRTHRPRREQTDETEPTALTHRALRLSFYCKAHTGESGTANGKAEIAPSFSYRLASPLLTEQHPVPSLSQRARQPLSLQKERLVELDEEEQTKDKTPIREPAEGTLPREEPPDEEPREDPPK